MNQTYNGTYSSLPPINQDDLDEARAQLLKMQAALIERANPIHECDTIQRLSEEYRKLNDQTA